MTLKYAASYARKSTPDDIGISDQHALNAQAAQANGFCIPSGPQFRFDDDFTTGITTTRDGLDRLVATVATGVAAFERVYVKDRTRLGRFDDIQRSAWHEVEFRNHNVPLRFVHNPSGADPEDPRQHMAYAVSATLESAAASLARKELIYRIDNGKRSRICRGRYTGSVTPLGMERWLYEESTGHWLERVEPGRPVRRLGCTYGLRLSEDVAEHELVRRIFADVLKGHSFQGIAAALNATRIPSPQRGRHLTPGWTGEKIHALVRNPLYKGELVYGRTTLAGEPVDFRCAQITDSSPIRIPDYLPPIIPPSTWDAVQAAIALRTASYRRRPGGIRTFLLSGLVRCVNCGAPYGGFTSSKANGRRYRYYRHDPRARADFPDVCPARNRYIRAERIEDEVTALLHQLRSDPALQDAVAEAFERDRAVAVGPDLSRRKELLVREREAIAARDRRLLMVRLEDSTADAANLLKEVSAENADRRQQIDEAIIELEGTQLAWAAAQRQQQTATSSALIATALEHATTDERRGLLEQAIATIRVDTDGPDVEVVFHTLSAAPRGQPRVKEPDPPSGAPVEA